MLIFRQGDNEPRLENVGAIRDTIPECWLPKSYIAILRGRVKTCKKAWWMCHSNECLVLFFFQFYFYFNFTFTFTSAALILDCTSSLVGNAINYWYTP